MHNWGEEGVDWEGIDSTAFEIGEYLTRWGRIFVSQTKEKYGEVRVYCSFGWSSFHQIIFPYHHWIHGWWPYQLDMFLGNYIFPLLNKLIIPYQQWVYKSAYINAIKKRPHLREEILDGADWQELLEELC